MRIPVHYHPLMLDEKLLSPSGLKPRFVVESWLDKKYPMNVVTPMPAGMSELRWAHDEAYIHETMKGTERTRTRPARYAVGSMLGATREALINGKVACSPTSGFHHAGWSSGSGYCTYNGLMVAAMYARMKHKVKNIGILDCDVHYGNGTDSIINALDLHGAVRHHTREAGQPSFDPADELGIIDRLLTVWAAHGVGLVLYQAGADSHRLDPGGDGKYTNETLYKRDLLVFERCKALRMPVVWNLAGGYQLEKHATIDSVRYLPLTTIHDHTMHACVQVFGGEP